MTALAGGGNRSPAAQLRAARRRLLDDEPQKTSEVEPTLAQSWKRSQDYGLMTDARTPGVPHASLAQLARAREQQQTLLSHARPVMQFMSEQIRESTSMVILSDSRGMLLHAMGDDHFVDRAARVALRPGANWHEQWRGTNAIGTALHARIPVRIHGAEHYLDRNAFLTCAAAPILGPAGQLLGAIDISGDHRSYHHHTLGLVRSAARMIEHQLFDTRHAGSLKLRIHHQAEGIGTVVEGLLALSEDGWIIGANSAALEMLGLAASDVGGVTLERALTLELQTLLRGHGGRTVGPPRQVTLEDGRTFWVRVEAPRSIIQARMPRAEDARDPSTVGRPAEAAQPAPDDALAALNTGDAALAAAIERARKVIDKPISLLLLGESGVGKELFARACHDSSQRRTGPYVAVNCAALPETLIEAELFGYRPGAFTGAAREGAPGRIREANGGTLFLDEIGDMPPPLQARLLRVLQEREVVPLGGGQPVAVDFQLICATHRQLRDDIAAGRFREDLYYRLNGLSLPLPPLRARSDLGALIACILERIAPDQPFQLSPSVEAAFARYHWPGNLRQLSNVLRTACALADDDLLDWDAMPADLIEDLARPSASAETGPAMAGAAPMEAQPPAAGPAMARGDDGRHLAPDTGLVASRHDDGGRRSTAAAPPSWGPLAPGGDAGGNESFSPPASADLRQQADRCIEEAVRHCQGNLSAAARRLGVSRNTLYRRLRAMTPR